MELPSKGFGGQREKNKMEKLRRIKDAARSLFIEKGYDETTTREIAVRAGVGVGTVFTYAENKRDLLFLIANDELEAVAEVGEGQINARASLLANLLAFFRPHYEFFGRQPVLSRMLLREMTFYDSGRQASRFQQTRDRNIHDVGRIVAMAIEAAMLRTREQPDFLGWVLFCIFQVELRRWLTTDEPLEAGVAQLERALRAFITGLEPTPAALRGAPPSGRRKSVR